MIKFDLWPQVDFEATECYRPIDAGHIIGRLLGGLGGKDAQNVFGQLSAINRGPFRDFEKKIAEQVLAGKLVEVEVILNYVGDSTRPSGVIYKVKVDGVPWKPVPFVN
jgi:hypothetical protein